MSLNKAQRRRVWRILKEGNWPLWHLQKDNMDKIFWDEFHELMSLRTRIKMKAISLGYDPEEDLVQ